MNTKILLEEQISTELRAFHLYRGLSHHFNHPNVAYKGYANFLLKQSNEELKHADEFVGYYQYLGYFYNPPQIKSFTVEKDTTVTSALNLALEMENEVLNQLEELHNKSDVKTQVFVEEYIKEQIDSIKEIQGMLSQAKDLDKTGLLVLDRQLM